MWTFRNPLAPDVDRRPRLRRDQLLRDHLLRDRGLGGVRAVLAVGEGRASIRRSSRFGCCPVPRRAEPAFYQ